MAPLVVLRMSQLKFGNLMRFCIFNCVTPSHNDINRNQTRGKGVGLLEVCHTCVQEISLIISYKISI